MKQFGKICKFELKSYLTNKIFVGVTVFLVAAITVMMFFPRIMGLFSAEEDTGEQNLPLLWLSGEGAEEAEPAFAAAFPGYTVRVGEDTPEQTRERVRNGEAACAFILHGPTSYTYCVDNLSMYDVNTEVADGILQSLYRLRMMVENGMTPEQAGEILSVSITHETESTGKDQMQNFFYTYIMIFALYMVILMYGQMVATNVATEKSSRAMEVLITSADPVAMMFGKVLASCLAGLIQLVAVFGSALLFYRVNRASWGENQIVQSIFNMPGDLFGYMLLFFVLGFLVYAFLYGAIGSTASKLEDINTSVMPVTLLFIFGFIVVMFSMIAGNVDSTLMRVCSYLPFTSPMAMFTRIAMSVVPWYETVISIGILVGSVIGIGILSARIYRVGVLLYGTPPKLGAILKAIRKQ